MCALQAVLAQGPQFNPIPFNSVPKEKPKVEHKENSLEDLFQHAEFPLSSLPPISLEGTTIPGLNAKNVHILSLYQFVVVDNSSYATMADLYRDNRLKGKANFVTSDSIVHPYMGFINGVHAAVIQEQITPRLMSLLAAMLKTAAADYKNAEDTSVREDVEKNLAYISTALRLLDPTLKVPALGNATRLADAEIKLILDGHLAHSAVFDKDINYSAYVPQGWYTTKEELKNYFRCLQWLTRTSFALCDVEKGEGGGSSFRRSILLYRSLEQATVNNAPAMNVWQTIYQLQNLFGAPAPSEKILLPTQYKSVLRSSTQDLNVTLNNLSEPFFRTKLMLSVRRQKPVEIGSASIFDLKSANKSTSETNAVFHFLPVVEEPELEWMRQRAHAYPDEGSDSPDCPLALLDLHCHGAGMATNILAESIWHLDPTLAQALPELMHSIPHKNPSQLVQTESFCLEDSRWQVISHFFRAMPDTVQPVFRTSQWLTRRLESGFAAWVDSHLSICPPDTAPAPATQNPQPGNTAAAPAAGAAGAPTAAVKPSNFQYLDPSPELYKRIAGEIIALQTQLNALNAFPQAYKTRAADFVRLCQRLGAIADREVGNLPMTAVDMQLLANIDIVLGKISVPVGGTFYLDTGDQTHGVKGCNLCVGKPGFLYLIMQTTHGLTLCRGATYTYFEVPGGPITAPHWQRKLDFATVRPPSWTSEFDVIQEPTRTPR
jgi:hypothetical protein